MEMMKMRTISLRIEETYKLSSDLINVIDILYQMVLHDNQVECATVYLLPYIMTQRIVIIYRKQSLLLPPKMPETTPTD